MLRYKKLLVASILAFFTFWPVAQRVLVARYDVSPWKLFGWAMYCRPPSAVAIRVERLLDGQGEPQEKIRAPEDWRQLADRFVNLRKQLGTLVGPDEVVAAVFEVNPDAVTIELTVTHTRLDSRTAMVQSRPYRYRFARAPNP